MAKKKQNIVITDKELTPTVIGILDTKEKSPIILIFLFAIFVAVAIFLPDITNYVDKLLNGNTNTNTPVTPTLPTNNDQEQEFENGDIEDEEQTIYYDYSEELSLNYDFITMSNIKVNNNTITFDLKNISNEEINLNNNKYFLELYTNDLTFLQRIKISYDTLASNETKNYNYDIDENTRLNFSKLLIVSKTEADYPEVTLTPDENGYERLICQKEHQKITYTFGNSELTRINDLVNYPVSSDDAYTSSLQSYQLLAATYNNYKGVSSTFQESITGFTYTTLIDLQNADVTSIGNNNYYTYRTLAKTVKFETEANGFICN